MEQLIHADLKDYRVFEPACHGCLKSHNEWFGGVEFEVILERIKFWTQWISKGPYENDKGRWLLREDFKKELPQLYTMSNGHARKMKERLMARTSRRSSRCAAKYSGKMIPP